MNTMWYNTKNPLILTKKVLWFFRKTLCFFRSACPQTVIFFSLFPEKDSIICRSYLDSGYSVYDLKSGKSTGVYLEKDFLFTPVYKEHTLLCAAGSTCLLVTGNGLYEKEGENWNLKIPSERTSMYLSSFAPLWAEKTGEADYSVFTYDSRYHYSPSANVPVCQDTIRLKLISLVETPFLKNAIVEYQMLHPEISLSYEFLCSEPPASVQEYNTLLQKINTAIATDAAAKKDNLFFLSALKRTLSCVRKSLFPIIIRKIPPSFLP